MDYSIVIPLMIIGIGTIVANMNDSDTGFVAMAGSRLMNPALFFLGSVSVVLGILSLFRRLYRFPLRILEFAGRNTLPIFGFNYVVKSYVNDIWQSIPTLPGKRPTWYIQTVIVYVLLLCVCLLWIVLKKLFSRVCLQIQSKKNGAENP